MVDFYYHVLIFESFKSTYIKDYMIGFDNTYIKDLWLNGYS